MSHVTVCIRDDLGKGVVCMSEASTRPAAVGFFSTGLLGTSILCRWVMMCLVSIRSGSVVRF